jgi:hypothetical protein
MIISRQYLELLASEAQSLDAQAQNAERLGDHSRAALLRDQARVKRDERARLAQTSRTDGVRFG